MPIIPRIYTRTLRTLLETDIGSCNANIEPAAHQQAQPSSAGFWLFTETSITTPQLVRHPRATKQSKLTLRFLLFLLALHSGQSLSYLPKQRFYIVPNFGRCLHEFATQLAGESLAFLVGNLSFATSVAFVADEHEDWGWAFHAEH